MDIDLRFVSMERERKSRLVYISGAITAPTVEEVKQNLARFDEVEAMLTAKGYKVYNPADNEVDEKHSLSGNDDGTWEYYVARDAVWIMTYRPSMYMMRGWKKSRGARLEHEIALVLGLAIAYEEE